MDIFSGVTLGQIALANRIVMAPMTRSRAGADAVPTAMMVDYYSQRAGAGLIISEGIAPSADGLGYCRTPGLYNEAQVAAWSRVTAAVLAGYAQRSTGKWRSLAARVVREDEVAGSNPAFPTRQL